MKNEVREAILAAHNADLNRDGIIVGLVSNLGLTLNAATKAYAEVAREEGWTTALVSHKEAALAFLRDAYPRPIWTAVAVRESVIDLKDRFGVAESTARDYARAYSEELGVDHPVEDPRTAMFNWLIENDGMDVEEMKAAFKEYARDLGRSDSNINEYWKGYELHLHLIG